MVHQARFCDQCGAVNRPHARFCTACGQSLQYDVPSQHVALPQITSREVQTKKALDIVICYAHEDETLRDKLIKQLYVLHRQGFVSLWYDRDISAGTEWAHEIDQHLNDAHIILLLVSPDFMASEYCYSIEMRKAIERHKRSEARVIPIILRPIHWQSTPLGELQALPSDAKPIVSSTWNNSDEAFFNVAEGIRKIVERFQIAEEKTLTSEEFNYLMKGTHLPDRELTYPIRETPTSNDPIGQRIGTYRLIRLIGEGSFSKVYLAKHISSDLLVAIKLIQWSLLGTSAERFLQDGQNLSRLIHPNIIRIIQVGIEDATPFLVMDYATNGTLRQRHPQGAQLSLSTVVNYVKQIAGALQYVHDRQHIHGDLKPENLLLGQHYEILLSDFSFDLDTGTDPLDSAKATPLASMAGTIPYMAPEQINGTRRRASDQYALGIIVYEWLSGSRPFSGSPTEIVT